jgi:gliding motility-associated-like protein
MFSLGLRLFIFTSFFFVLTRLSGQVHFTDSFKTNLNNWDIKTGTWNISSSTLIGYWNLSSGGATASQATMLLDSRYQLDDSFEVSVDFTRVADIGNSNYYQCAAGISLYKANNDKIQFYLGNGGNNWGSTTQDTIRYTFSQYNGRWSGKNVWNIWSNKYSYNPNNWQNLTFEKFGNRYVSYFNGNKVGFFFDCFLDGDGDVGFHTYGTKKYDNFTITKVVPSKHLDWLAEEYNLCGLDSIELSMELECVDSVRWSTNSKAETINVKMPGTYKVDVYSSGFHYTDSTVVNGCRDTIYTSRDTNCITLVQTFIDSFHTDFLGTIPNANTVDDKLFFFGKRKKPLNSSVQTSEDSIRSYNLATSKWETYSFNLPYSIHGMTQAINKGQKFLLSPDYDNGQWSGIGGKQKVVEVDFEEETAKETANVNNSSLWNMASCKLNDSIIIGGGYSGGDKVRIYKYDTASEALTYLFDFKYGRSMTKIIPISSNEAVVMGGNIYATSNANRIEKINFSSRISSLYNSQLPSNTTSNEIRNLICWHIPSQKRIYYFQQGLNKELKYFNYEHDFIGSTGITVDGEFAFASIQDSKDSSSVYVFKKGNSGRFNHIYRLDLDFTNTLADDFFNGLGNDTVLCSEQSTPLYLNSNSYDSLYWNDNSTKDTIWINNSGRYSVEIYRNQCSTKISKSVTFIDTKIINLNDTFCIGDTIELMVDDYDQIIPDRCDTTVLPNSIRQSLTSYYTFCDSTYDLSGNGNNLIASNLKKTYSTLYEAGTALEFNGVSSQLKASMGNIFQDSFSFIGWYKWEKPSNSSSWFSFFSKSSYCDDLALMYNSQGKYVRLYTRNNCLGSKDFFNIELDSCKWYQVALTYDKQNCSFYLNGKKMGNVAINQISENDTLYIGSMKQSYVWSGKVDDVMIVKKTLDEKSLTELYNARKPLSGCISYLWSDNTTSKEYSGLIISDSTISVRTIGDNFQCIDSINAFVSVIDASITPAGPFCENGGIQTLSAAVNTGGWFTNTSYLDSAGNFNPAIATSGSHTVFYTFTDDNGCTETDSTTILIDTIPDASISAAGPFCENGGIQTLSAAVNTAGWFTNTSYLDSVGNFNPAVAQTGSHQVYYTYTDSNGCTDTDSTTILVDTIPDASITPAGPFCVNARMQVLSGAVNPGGTFNTTSYLDNAGNFDPALATPGSYLVYYTFVDGNNCSAIDSITITVHPTEDPTITGPTSLCINDDPVQFNSASTQGSFGGGSYINPTGLFNPQQANIGLNEVWYDVTNTFGCRTADTVEVNILDAPANEITIDPIEGCDPLGVTVSTDPADSLIWDIAGDVFYNQESVTSTYGSGNYVVTLRAKNGLGCEVIRDSSFIVHPNPIADFNYSPDVIYISNPLVQFEDESTGNIVDWYWDFGNGFNTGQQNPNHRYNAGGEYNIVLLIEDDNGCVDTAEQTLIVKDELLALTPNAFTPNGDGLNDVFQFRGKGMNKISLSIYNRWGEKLYANDDFVSWDGTIQGKKLPEGTYIFTATIISSTGQKHFKKGTLHLLRPKE